MCNVVPVPGHYHGSLDRPSQRYRCVSGSSVSFIATHSYPASSIHAGLQGQEAGNTLVDILWGAVNPSGRLPYTIAKSPSDYSADIGPNHDVDYTEGLYIDYRWFDLVCYVSSPIPGSSEC